MKLYHKNPRQITEKQFTDLGGSLSRLGDLGGIVHDLNSDEIIGGNQRSRVFDINQCEIDLKEQYLEPDEQGTVGLGFVIWKGKKYAYRQVRWTAKQCEEANIRANKNGGSFDFDTLANEFELDDLLEWGFDKKELDIDLWAGNAPEDPGAQIDKAEELRVKWGVESGQLWKLGEHRLICGDCTDRAVVERVMQGEKAGAIVTDPPYGINREGIENDDPEGLTALFDDCLSVMPIENTVIIAFQSPRLFPVWLDAIRAHGHKFERELWMHKSNDVTQPWRGWMMNGEPIFISSVNSPKWGESSPVQDCYIITHDIKVKIAHKSVKPIGVTEDLIKHTTDNVYDPFLGSGTTLIACERLHRKCRAVEISPAYCAVAIQRWVDMTGGIPELVENSRNEQP